MAIGAVQITAESPSNEQLNNFYENFISEKIAKSHSKTDLKNLRSENLRLAGEKAEKEAEFLARNKDILVYEMVDQNIGKKPYKVEHYLNKRFKEYNDCIVLAETDSVIASMDNPSYACK